MIRAGSVEQIRPAEVATAPIPFERNRCMMTRFVLAATILSCVITSIALSADGPENRTSAPPAPAKSAPIYVKLLLPDDPAAPVVKGEQPVVESWIIKSIDEEQRQANYRAVTGWVRLVSGPFEGTPVWPGGTLDGVGLCSVDADIFERKDGRIKIEFHGWTPGGARATVTLQDEPGSREVVPVTEAKTKHGVPHVAIFIGLQD
jgi:hypothetical protein